MAPLGAGGQEQAAGVPVLGPDGEVGIGRLDQVGDRRLVETEGAEILGKLVVVRGLAARRPVPGGLDQFFRRACAPFTAST